MNNIKRIVKSGVCTGCGACNSCEHISFEENKYGFYNPVADDKCTGCGNCVKQCIYDPIREDDADD